MGCNMDPSLPPGCGYRKPRCYLLLSFPLVLFLSGHFVAVMRKETSKIINLLMKRTQPEPGTLLFRKKKKTFF